MLCSYLTENATVGYRGQLISLTVDGVPSVLKKKCWCKVGTQIHVHGLDI